MTPGRTTSPLEHECFAAMTEHLRFAAERARQMAAFRPDQSHLWEQLSDNFKLAIEKLHDIAMKGVIPS